MATDIATAATGDQHRHRGELGTPAPPPLPPQEHVEVERRVLGNQVRDHHQGAASSRRAGDVLGNHRHRIKYLAAVMSTPAVQSNSGW